MKKFIISLAIISLSIIGYAKEAETKTITGQVTELVNGNEQPIALAYIYCDNSIYTTYTNENGEFAIDIPKGKHNIKVSFKGYVASEQLVNSKKTNNLNFELKPLEVAER